MSVPDTAYFDPTRDSFFVGGLMPSDTLLDTLKALPSSYPKESIYLCPVVLFVVLIAVVWIARKPRTAKDEKP